MARTYAQDLAEISAVFQQIGPGERDALLWRATLDICNENDLSFMIGEGRLVTDAPYKTGTVATTEDGTGLVLTDGTWSTGWANRKVKIQGREESYSIASFPTTTTATLTEAWLGSTTTGLSYFIYRDVYPLPVDCELTKEVLLYDTVLKERVEFVDYAEFRARKREMGVILGSPCEVARIGMTTSGVAQLEFGPRVPDTERVYTFDYFRSPQKPVSLNSVMSPAWPTAFEDVRAKRAISEYAFRKGHPRRFEFKNEYEDRIFRMVAKFDGGNEMRRRIRGTRRGASAGLTVHARWGGN